MTGGLGKGKGGLGKGTCILDLSGLLNRFFN